MKKDFKNKKRIFNKAVEKKRGTYKIGEVEKNKRELNMIKSLVILRQELQKEKQIKRKGGKEYERKKAGSNKGIQKG